MLYSIFVLDFKNVKSTFSVKCHVFQHFDHNFYFTSSHEYATLLLWLCKCFQRHCNKSLVYLNNWKMYFKSRVFLYENSKHFIWRRKQCHLFVHILYAIKLYSLLCKDEQLKLGLLSCILSVLLPKRGPLETVWNGKERLKYSWEVLSWMIWCTEY